MAIAGIDVGTTGCKCTVCSDEGLLIKETYQEYDIKKEDSGRELDAWEVWKGVEAVAAQAFAGLEEDLRAIGVTSFGETVTFTDGDGRPLMNSMLYVDRRGEDQCRKLQNKFGPEGIFGITGASPQPMYSISKLMWVKQEWPDVYEKAEHIFQFGDYIVYMLSGNAQIDYSLACRSMAFDFRNKNWSSTILDAAGIDASKLSDPAPTGSAAGKIRPELAEKWGVSKDVLIVSGCHDQIAAAVGTGCLEKGMAVDGTGTVECITPVFAEPENPGAMCTNNYVMVPYVNTDEYVTYAFSFNGGSLLKWYRDNIAPAEAAVFKYAGMNVYNCFNAQIKADDPSGLLVLPYFSGSATPYMDGAVRGAILGIGDDTTSIDIYQALMEGVTYEMLLNIELLAGAGIDVNELRATGGGAQAEVWLQMKADILNRKIVTLGNAQSGTLGCIMMSGVACGLFKDLKEAAGVYVKTGKEYLPDPGKHERYMEFYAKYKKLYGAVKEVME